MGDNFDPCECICSAQWAMRRLLSILRTNQRYCTDNECFNDMPGSNDTADNGMFFMFALWMILVIVLFLFRPASMQRPIGPEKNNQNGQGDQPPPDAPPVQ